MTFSGAPMGDGQNSLHGANISFKNPFKGGLIDPAAVPNRLRCPGTHSMQDGSCMSGRHLLHSEGENS